MFALTDTELVGLSLVENRFLLALEGSDVGPTCLLLGNDGGSVAVLENFCWVDGGLDRPKRGLRNMDFSSRGLAGSSHAQDECVGESGFRGDMLLRKGTSTESSISSYTFATARSSVSGGAGACE